MVFCGYNETMAQGLAIFVEGMIEAMVKRNGSGTPMPEVLRTELLDLAALNESLSSASRERADLTNALVAINTFAQTIFSRTVESSSSADEFAAECRRAAQSFIELVKLTEERHQYELARLAAHHGDKRAIECVGEWVLQTTCQLRAERCASERSGWPNAIVHGER